MSSVLIAGHDGSPRGDDALGFARLLASRLGARVVVANVLETSPVHGGHGVAYDDATARLEDIAAATGAPDELRLVEATSAARGLSDLAAELEAELVVVGACHRSAFGQAILGTVAERLLRDAPCGVALARPHGADEPVGVRRIAVAYDGSSNARAALRWAVTLAGASGAQARVDVITVADLTAALAQPVPALVASRVAPADPDAAADRAGHGLGLVPQRLRGEVATPVGLPGQAIARAAAKLGSDLVICGSRRHGPLRRVLAGSTARDLLHHAACPVLVVPAGNDLD